MAHRTLLLGVFLLAAGPAQALELVQHVSREHPAFRPAEARLTVGRDGKVYLISGGTPSYVVRLRPDGTEKSGAAVVYAGTAVAADPAGTVATANAHFSHSVNLYDDAWNPVGANADFLNNDAVGWDAPAAVEAGARGDFFALDQHRDRIVRLGHTGKHVATHAARPADGQAWGPLEALRVSQPASLFVLRSRQGGLHGVDFEGRTCWTVPGPAAAFDVDEGGRLVVVGGDGTVVRRFTAEGKPDGETRLELAPADAHAHPVTDLRILGTTWVVKRRHPTELFRVHDGATGKLVRTVAAAVERLTVTLPDGPWFAAEDCPVTVRLEGAAPLAQPDWRVYLRPTSGLTGTVLSLTGGKFRVPAGAAGVYQFRLTTDGGGQEAEYTVQTLVTVRPRAAKGCVTTMSPTGRHYFARGEAVPVEAIARPAQAATVRLTLTTAADERRGSSPPSAKPWDVALNPQGRGTLEVPAALIAQFQPGRYVLTAALEGYGSVPWEIEIGPGRPAEPGILRVQYGDYGLLRPEATRWNAPETVARHLERSRKLGFNLFVERLGTHLHVGETRDGGFVTDADLAQRLQADPAGPAPELARTLNPLMQTVAGYGACGMQEMPILLYMDAGLPLGTPHDPRKPEQLAKDIAQVTKTLAPYPAFRGWAWNANWWVNRIGADAVPADRRAAYQAALQKAEETGAWDPILDEVSETVLGQAEQAQEFLNAELLKHLKDRVSAFSGPYRNVTVYPPRTFGRADEVDLHYQAEQIQPPNVFPHNVDYQKRPGKLAWAHPELWNDSGTGDQILPTSFALLMRGADGIGVSGQVPNWPRQPEDGRNALHGTASVFRALNHFAEAYGPWLRQFKNADRVGILVGQRMVRIDRWQGIGGRHFDRLFEAYQSCLAAHHPASFLFAEDVTPQTWQQFRAVLLVDQRVAFDPKLAEALASARAAGVKVFHDGTCRPELVKEFAPLGIAFDQVSRDPHTWQDDSAYWRFPAYYRRNVPALRQALDPVVARPALVEDSAIHVSERRAGDARIVWVVSQTMADELEPGQLWRVGQGLGTRVPAVVKVKLDVPAEGVVYDVFAQKRVESRGGVVEADLRSLPGRLFAVLPHPASGVLLSSPGAIRPGPTHHWQVDLDPGRLQGGSLPLPVKLRWRLLDGTILDDRFSACNGPTDFRFTLPERLPGRPFFVLLEVWHLLSGHGIESIHAIQYPGEEEPRSPRRTEPDGSPTKPLPLPSIDARLGPRLRDLAVSPDGRRAVVTAFNLEDNLYGLDLETGGQRWWHKAGHHFAYAPQALKDGFAVTGFDFATAEGYHLYRFDGAGHPQRRYALYGLPKRGINWAFAGIHADSICNFAAAADGSWVAAAGDLGLAVWDAEGKLLWSQDWWAAERKTVVLLAAGDALIVGDGIRATAYDGRTGKIRWLRTLAPQGRILGGRATPNARTVALRADTDGGRVFVLRDGEPVAVLPVAADDLALAADGGAVAVVIGREVRWYEGGALQWTLAGDDLLFAPRLRADGSALAVCSQLGTVYVLDARGTTLDTFDLGSVAAPAWLPDGDLVLAAWQGFVVRRDVAGHRHRWVSRLTPSTADVRGKLLAAADVPTTRRTGWGNATAEPLPLTPNLLAETRAIVQARLGDQAVEWQHNPAALTDGKAEPPPGPWLAWSDVQMIDSGWRGPAAVVFDTFRTQLRVTDVTFVEDAAKPHSWCRDVLLQVWDPRAEQWRDVQRLLSDAAVHSHHLAKPAEGARFRLVSTGGAWPVGNLRWGEVVFHGTALGPSHPDALAKQPVAVLFDEDVRDFKAAFEHGHNPGFQVRADVGAFRGSHYLAFDPAAKPEAAPAFQAPFGHALPGWDFPIAENPGPGEYRYLQFACKALVPAATQATLQAGPARFTVKPEGEWRQYRIDLWELAGKKPFRLQDLRLGAAGGAVAFDRILLGRGGADLPPVGDGR